MFKKGKTNRVTFGYFLILFFLLLPFLSHGIQFEGGVNYRPKNEWTPFGTFTFFPVTIEEELSKRWTGLAVEATYERESIYLSLLYGQLDFEDYPIKSVYVGFKYNVVEFNEIGLQLKGTNYYLPWLPVTIAIDPKYSFQSKSIQWDFKLSTGIGKHFPLF